MNIEELLPIGSIVQIKNSEKRLMIFGIKQSGIVESENVEADYIGVLYPEGNMGLQYQYLFNHDDIEEIVYRGFEDSERDIFVDQLAEIYRQGQEAV